MCDFDQIVSQEHLGESIDHPIRIDLLDLLALGLEVGHDTFDLLQQPEAWAGAGRH